MIDPNQQIIKNAITVLETGLNDSDADPKVGSTAAVIIAVRLLTPIIEDYKEWYANKNIDTELLTAILRNATEPNDPNIKQPQDGIKKVTPGESLYPASVRDSRDIVECT